MRQQATQMRQNNRMERFFEVDEAAARAGHAGSSPAAFPVTDANGQGKGYRYEHMLTCIHETLTKSNKGTSSSERNQLPAPQIEMIGKKKTMITNFGRLCEVFHRTPEEVKEFIEQELTANGNLDSKQALILKYQARKANDFDKLFIRYLDEYVKCNACHRIDTTLTKENRILTLHCNVCTATRTVNVSHDNTYAASTEKRSIKRNAITL
ncbi:translation initiation factor 2 subunit 2 [Strigomonas culicis]|uniref:Translation initiation factor 2 subunit 2 n=1 Tax=Strigomonas culicis TaxID=28005 RepID=S9VNR7_9TRYP|nr:translation initiation factor 2 subunit 2 [Strigomonas culicis]EPY24940.1 translation initiation factor 2 subunit 2 [Strigomonas culicis]EPY36632.1 translation initiation factor 2 subunit 2 [Strigomonas culicis]|eukprot:EPY24624.1 translation initiation factor 2 subunit 2 [Strigomonas culicis]